jgi:hypothetical protein
MLLPHPSKNNFRIKCGSKNKYGSKIYVVSYKKEKGRYEIILENGSKKSICSKSVWLISKICQQKKDD